MTTDPYLDDARCEERLYTEYKTHGRLLIATDYDDTLYDFHSKGFTYPKVLQLLLDAQEVGCLISIFTGSPPDQYPIIRERAAAMGLTVASININPIPLPFGNHGKMYFNVLLDDRAGLGQAYRTLRAVIDRVRAERA